MLAWMNCVNATNGYHFLFSVYAVFIKYDYSEVKFQCLTDALPFTVWAV